MTGTPTSLGDVTEPGDRIDWLAVVAVVAALGIFAGWTWAIAGGW